MWTDGRTDRHNKITYNLTIYANNNNNNMKKRSLINGYKINKNIIGNLFKGDNKSLGTKAPY